MSDYLTSDNKTGPMIRGIMGDVSLEVKQIVEELYGDTPAGHCCAKWHWRIVKYSKDPIIMRRYISLILFAYQNDLILDEMFSWRKTMLITIPEEFMYKMQNFQQVAQMAVMDDTHAESRKKYREEYRDASELLW